jgi:hypothetical protein
LKKLSISATCPAAQFTCQLSSNNRPANRDSPGQSHCRSLQYASLSQCRKFILLYNPSLIRHISYTGNSRQGLMLSAENKRLRTARDGLSHAGFILYRQAHEKYYAEFYWWGQHGWQPDRRPAG